MSRKTVHIGLGELRTHMEEMKEKYPEFPYNLSDRLEKDLSKIQFDWENWDLGELEILKDGLAIQWAWAGGDWEWPVNFVFYWSGKRMRAYIPEKGNVFNRKTRQAYGNEADPIDDKDVPNPDYDLMRKDIISRIKFRDE